MAKFKLSAAVLGGNIANADTPAVSPALQKYLEEAPSLNFGLALMEKGDLSWNGSSMSTSGGARVRLYSPPEEDTWYFTNLIDYAEASRTFGEEFPSFPPKKYIKARMQLMHDRAPAYLNAIVLNCIQSYVPNKLFFEELLVFCKTLSETLDKCDLAYWKRAQKPSLYPFTTMIDTDKAKSIIEDPQETNKEAVISFMAPNSQFLRAAPQYIRTGTVTGRMTVLSGPPILTLKKDHRSILRSPDLHHSKFWSFDYTSLEPRVLLYLSEYIKSNPSSTPLIGSLPRPSLAHLEAPDVYLKVLDDLGLTGKLPRPLAKNAILAVLYGQNEENTASQLKRHISKPEDFVASLLDYFGIDLLRKSLARDLLYSNRNAIKSFYGRPIFCEDTRPSVLLNYYVQSTAVDVALHGFNKICKRLNEKSLISIVTPVFLIHDAMIVDMENDRLALIPKIEKLGSLGIDGFEDGNFFLRAQEFVPSQPTGASIISSKESDEK